MADLYLRQGHLESALDIFRRLVGQRPADERLREQIYDFYLQHIRFINNWDLVDGSAPYIVGPYLLSRSRRQLYAFAKSNSVWERRIAIIATFYFIRRNDFADALEIAARLLSDDHDLIHKAVGWMLREIGKRDQSPSPLSIHRSPFPTPHGSANTVTVIDPGGPSQNPAAIPETTATYCLPLAA